MQNIEGHENIVGITLNDAILWPQRHGAIRKDIIICIKEHKTMGKDA
jgi:hypothetical protein